MSLTSYASTGDLTSYAADRGVTLAAGSQSAALVRATMALDAMYALRWVGQKADYTQQTQWPRVNACWPDGTTVSGVPQAVVSATCEFAIQELISPGVMTPIVTPGKTKQRVRVEGAIDVTYAADTEDLVSGQVPVLTVVEGLLWGLVGLRQILPGALVV